jgi:hypothetical protein
MRFLRQLVAVVVCSALVLAMAGCGTLFGNKNPEVGMGSDPQGAKVYVNGDLVGNTPVKIQLKNDKDYVIEFRKDGFQSKSYVLGKHVGATWIVLDILGGFWPIIVDLATGGWYELDSTNVKVLLEKN